MMDQETEIQISMLAQEAALVAYAFRRDGEFRFIPEIDPAFDACVRTVTDEQGGVFIAVVALMKHRGLYGEALIEYVEMPGVTEEDAKNVAALFKLWLMESGLLVEKDGPRN